MGPLIGVATEHIYQQPMRTTQVYYPSVINVRPDGSPLLSDYVTEGSESPTSTSSSIQHFYERPVVDRRERNTVLHHSLHHLNIPLPSQRMQTLQPHPTLRIQSHLQQQQQQREQQQHHHQLHLQRPAMSSPHQSSSFHYAQNHHTLYRSLRRGETTTRNSRPWLFSFFLPFHKTMKIWRRLFPTVGRTKTLLRGRKTNREWKHRRKTKIPAGEKLIRGKSFPLESWKRTLVFPKRPNRSQYSRRKLTIPLPQSSALTEKLLPVYEKVRYFLQKSPVNTYCSDHTRLRSRPVLNCCDPRTEAFSHYTEREILREIRNGKEKEWERGKVERSFFTRIKEQRDCFLNSSFSNQSQI